MQASAPETVHMAAAKVQLEQMLKPFQQELNKRHKKSEFVKKCIQCIEKHDFFQVDELLKSTLAAELLQDSHFEGCASIFSDLRRYADHHIERYRLQFRHDFISLGEQAGLMIDLDGSQFSVLKGIEGRIDFSERTTTINQTSIKSIDPRRIIALILNIQRKLYDPAFEPQKFIDTLFECYREILNKSHQGIGNSVLIGQLYTDYVLALQSKNFFQNMDKGKFKGCSIEQFAVDLWRFFQSDASSTEGGYRLKLSSGRGKSFWLIDHDGHKRQITHASFVKLQP